MIVFNHLPVVPLRITSHFGPRNTGLVGASTYHKGIDLGRDFSKSFTQLHAVAEGTVTNNYWNDTRGWVIIIKHNDFSTLYQHLNQQSPLTKGTKVKSGDVIGVMGKSTKTIKNMSTHLHFELIVNGLQINPIPYLYNIQEVEDLTREETLALIKEVLLAEDKAVSKWAFPTWTKAKAKGYTDGTRPQGYCTREQVMSMILRAVGE